ncbi:putative hydro-lyase [Alkalihalophilus lindianensis]|uniref:Putative hydro-lyase RYX56_16500 n=1 Tax=Alkalihalophilus lindianensis TaxID=1630542 RepID=A0ABU3XDL1_9BACI|nr:putative hydro-lyase [Alkalihalophilus lindianensis]MDV2685969.1 putative hydro-lyase [Alkalihalophilus lindianensis]
MITPVAFRQQIREQQFTSSTAGYCQEFVQANLVIVPKQYAFDFFLYTFRNQKACPVIDVLEPGQVESLLAKASDIRTDIPKYHIYEGGTFEKEVESIEAIWEDDFVSFLIGCSFTFESEMIKTNIPLKHIELQKNVAMYQTNIETVAAGPFSGPLVVSMRPIKKELVQLATSITEKYPQMHGGPVHIGDPAQIGISEIEKPDYGEYVEIADDEVPIFWACGVTPQAAAQNAKLPIMITHAPGHMFITDWTNEELLNKDS